MVVVARSASDAVELGAAVVITVVEVAVACWPAGSVLDGAAGRASGGLAGWLVVAAGAVNDGDAPEVVREVRGAPAPTGKLGWAELVADVLLSTAGAPVEVDAVAVDGVVVAWVSEVDVGNEMEVDGAAGVVVVLVAGLLVARLADVVVELGTVVLAGTVVVVPKLGSVVVGAGADVVEEDDAVDATGTVVLEALTEEVVELGLCVTEVEVVVEELVGTSRAHASTGPHITIEQASSTTNTIARGTDLRDFRFGPKARLAKLTPLPTKRWTNALPAAQPASGGGLSRQQLQVRQSYR